MLQPDVSGHIPAIFMNKEGLYEGDMRFYLRVLFFEANNLHNPYHNLRHTLHVVWLCHNACRYYKNELTPRQMRNLLIAALFHDFDHPGHPHPGEKDPDRINIELAVAALRRHAMPGDRAFLPEIEAVIQATHFPYKAIGDQLDLLSRIIRDADLAQALNPAWLQQVVMGLAQEWATAPLEVLRLQPSFLEALPFNTPWARELFPREIVEAKIKEAKQLLLLLEPEPQMQTGERTGRKRRIC
jgi:HD domain